MLERIAFEYRKDEPFRVVKDGCVGTIRCMEGGGVSKYIMEVKVIGQMDNTIDHTFESANRVYDVGGCCPTINTCGGGGLQPKIIQEVKELGFMDNGTGKHQSNTVVDENGLAPTITTINGGGTQQIKVLTENIPCTTSRVVNGKFADVDDLSLININKTESGAVVSRYYKGIEGDHSDAVIVAMRGRNPENPSDRTVGAPTEQRLEPNSQGICNTLTSVTKDNLVLEKNVAALRMVRTEEGKALRKQYENHEITHGFNEHRVAEPREDNCSNTLSTVQKDNMLLETVRIKQATKDGYIECKVGGVADLSFPDSTTRRGRVQDGGDVCPTLMAGEQDICRIENQYRIRKLTPRECYRLMAVPEESIDKMLEVNSNTQCYKQAGNSIVVNCLIAIFSQMGIQGIPRWNEGLCDKYK